MTPTYTPTATPTAPATGTNITKYYYFGSQRVAMRTSSGITYFFGDHPGSTCASIAPDGSLAKQGYFAFGGGRYNVGVLPTDYTFTGQKSDVSDGLMFYGARYYDANIERFIQPDSIIPNLYNPQSLNRYAYVRNNPLRYTDPTGHMVSCGNDDPTCGQGPNQNAPGWTPPNNHCELDPSAPGCQPPPATTAGNQEPCTQNCGGSQLDDLCAKHPNAKMCRDDDSVQSSSGGGVSVSLCWRCFCECMQLFTKQAP